MYKDPRIDILLKKQAEANDLSTRNTSKRRTARGYRLLVVSSNNRNEALAARTKVLTNFPELKAYMWYQSPYYKVKAGNFTSRNDAQAYQKRMASMFPGNIFIMNDIVEVKPEEADQQD
ncbi:SPOR domain-containing protein [Niabella sp. W65]|nr:SPOR domain-containing protein [Niabella sp. W65]MCH7363523.1 SPOR domain-containing protein [Niabella sp. W65]ULT39442.1 SPOR domain-containing protein [Niabella sp. I65]